MVILTGMDDQGDFAGATGAACCESSRRDIRHIRAHQVRHDRTLPPLGPAETGRETLGSTGLVIQKLTVFFGRAIAIQTLRELSGVHHIHAVGPAVVGLTHQRIGVVAVRIVGRLVAAERRGPTVVAMGATEYGSTLGESVAPSTAATVSHPAFECLGSGSGSVRHAP